MRITGTMSLSVGLLSLLVFSAGSAANAQITNVVEATISHDFIVGTKTLPAGKYVFQMQQGSSGAVMTVTSENGKASDVFTVRESQAPAVPAHTQLIFRRYGDKEFLSKVFQAGSKTGVAVAGESKLEKELIAKGQQASEHTEENGGQ